MFTGNFIIGRPRPNAHPASAGNSTREDRVKQLAHRQYVCFAFYKLDPLWCRLDANEQVEQKQELAQVIRSFYRCMLLRPYSLIGTRADNGLILWQIAESPTIFRELTTAIVQTRMDSYLNLVYSYISQTKHCIYEIRGASDPTAEEERLVIDASEAKYLFVYPFVKSHRWYKMSQDARRAVMDEHIEVGREYPSK